MFTEKEVTIERAEAYLAGLEREKVGYAERIKRVEAGRRDPLEADDLKDRMTQVDEEIKRAKALISSEKKKRDGDSDAKADE